MIKRIEIVSGIVFIILGLLWIGGLLFDWPFSTFIEPITIVVTGLVWLILATYNYKQQANTAKGKIKKKTKGIFQVHFGKGDNQVGNRVSKKKTTSKK